MGVVVTNASTTPMMAMKNGREVAQTLLSPGVNQPRPAPIAALAITNHQTPPKFQASVGMSSQPASPRTTNANPAICAEATNERFTAKELAPARMAPMAP